jgi:hypothetical protein
LGGGDRLTFDFNVINISENYIEPLIVWLFFTFFLCFEKLHFTL